MSDKPIRLVGGPCDGRVIPGTPQRVHIVPPEWTKVEDSWMRAEYRRRDEQQIGADEEIWEYVEPD